MMLSENRRTLLALCVVALAGCEGGTAMMPTADAGTDAPPADAGRYVCDQPPIEVEASLDTFVTVSVDTRTATREPIDLGVHCGNTEATATWPKQVVIAVKIPGSGPLSLGVNSRVGATDPKFRTVFQLRRSCTFAPQTRKNGFDACAFDSEGFNGDHRGYGSFMVEGGETVLLFVTGWGLGPGETETLTEGVVEFDLMLGPNTAPTLTGGAFEVSTSSGDVSLSVSGSDAERNAARVYAYFIDQAGAVVDIWGDGEASEQSFYPISIPPNTSATSFTQTVRVQQATTQLGGFVLNNGFPTVRLVLVDAAGLASAPRELDIVTR
jgi:hypothetical protein